MITSTTTPSTLLRRSSWHCLHLGGSAALGLALGAGMPACGGDGQSDTSSGSSGPLECEPGMSYDCACTDGSMGTQRCAADSSGLTPCTCGGEGTATSTSSSADGSATSTSGTSDTPGSTGPVPGTDTSADGSTSAGPTGTSEDSSTNGAAPVAQINNPGDGQMRPAGVVIPFVGEATDLEDGLLTGASLVWVDSVEGEIGQGESFDIVLPTLGQHTITLTATDADGNVGEDSITITVFE